MRGKRPRGVAPLVDVGNFLPDKRRVGGCLVPAHAGDRMLALPLGIVSQLPGRGAWLARLVVKEGDGLLPGQRPPGVDERLLPQLAPAVAALVDEPLELTVRHLGPVDQ